jgi:hypothetical protein
MSTRETTTTAPTRSEAPIFLTGLLTAWRRPVAWTLYLVAVLAASAPAMLMAQRSFADMIRARYARGEQLHSFDAAFRVDHQAALARLGDSLGTLAGAAALVALLFGVFAGGGWLGVLLDGPERPVARRFLAGGVRYFWRFTRLLLVVLLVLAALHWAIFEWPSRRFVLQGYYGLARADLSLLRSEATAHRLDWAQSGIHGLLVGAVLAWALYTRARLALQGGSSVLLAGFATLWTILRHPLRTLRPLVLLVGVELLVVAVGLGALSRAFDRGLIDDPAAWRVIGLAAISFTALLVGSVVFGARYAVATEVLRGLVQPLPRPDPWRDRVGPPGGPQYPIGGGDEFSVSV